MMEPIGDPPVLHDLDLPGRPDPVLHRGHEAPRELVLIKERDLSTQRCCHGHVAAEVRPVEGGGGAVDPQDFSLTTRSSCGGQGPRIGVIPRRDGALRSRRAADKEAKRLGRDASWV